MKNKIFLLLLTAGLGVAGCSSSREGRSGTDTLMNGMDTTGSMDTSTMGTRNDTIDTNAAPGTIDTLGNSDTTRIPQ